LTKKPTNAPTNQAESPAIISGTVWYDANGDGRHNDPNSALTNTDFLVSEEERGAGIGNFKVLLRQCGDDTRDLGVTYTFPSGMNVNSGNAEVFDADYLQEIQSGDYSAEGSSSTLPTAIGYYSFKVLPNMIPGEFYVVFQAPLGYKLTGGSGTYWEVHEEVTKDRVLPMVESVDGGRMLQFDDDYAVVGSDTNETMAANQTMDANQTMAVNQTMDANQTIGSMEVTPNNVAFNPTNKPTSYAGPIPKLNNFVNAIDLDTPITNVSDISPITHSGYFSRSRCISIKSNPMVIDEINAGMTEATWPLLSFQYASFILILTFYEQSTIDQSIRQLQDATECGVATTTSLECREYFKKKCEGNNVPDLWGCETPVNTGPVYDFEELNMEEVGI
jgi:hypothetical protein